MINLVLYNTLVKYANKKAQKRLKIQFKNSGNIVEHGKSFQNHYGFTT